MDSQKSKSANDAATSEMTTKTNASSNTADSKTNQTGLPDALKTGLENLSGYALDDVNVHYNSDKPAQLRAHAYAQGSNIHLGPGQEKHLPHEAWHVVQQKQGRVNPTVQLKGNIDVNDDPGLEKEADIMGAKAAQSTAKEQEETLLDRPAFSQVVQGIWLTIQGELKKTQFTNNHDGTYTYQGKVYVDVKGSPGVVKLAPAGAGKQAKIGTYKSDDEMDMSSGDEADLYRASTASTSNVKAHSSYSTAEQARASIREMRGGKPLTNPDPTLLKMGSQLYEFTPTPARKDFGVSPTRPTEDGSGVQRSGGPRTYAVLAADLDKSALRCGLSMAQMNQALKYLLFTNENANAMVIGLPAIDGDCLKDLRELSAILILDMSRSHNGRAAIQAQVLGSTSSFTKRFGGSNPEYGGAQSKKKHGMGGVQYLREYDDD
ncbi:MAG: DUF4157 domain-containing protein [Gilvibacter sp.]